VTYVRSDGLRKSYGTVEAELRACRLACSAARFVVLIARRGCGHVDLPALSSTFWRRRRPGTLPVRRPHDRFRLPSYRLPPCRTSRASAPASCIGVPAVRPLSAHDCAQDVMSGPVNREDMGKARAEAIAPRLLAKCRASVPSRRAIRASFGRPSASGRHRPRHGIAPEVPCWFDEVPSALDPIWWARCSTS